MRRTVTTLVLLAIAGGSLAGCTSSAHPGAPSSGSTAIHTVTTTNSPDPSATAPVATGPTKAATVTSCPFAATQRMANTSGMRLARIQKLTSGGKVIGCRFYALQGSPLHSSENLPGPSQPALEITSSRFASSTAAHNAMVRLATAGANPIQFTVAKGNIGLAYQARFDPTDGNRDWAAAFTKGSTLVLVRIAQPDAQFDVTQTAKAIAGQF